MAQAGNLGSIANICSAFCFLVVSVSFVWVLVALLRISNRGGISSKAEMPLCFLVAGLAGFVPSTLAETLLFFLKASCFLQVLSTLSDVLFFVILSYYFNNIVLYDDSGMRLRHFLFLDRFVDYRDMDCLCVVVGGKREWISVLNSKRPIRISRRCKGAAEFLKYAVRIYEKQHGGSRMKVERYVASATENMKFSSVFFGISSSLLWFFLSMFLKTIVEFVTGKNMDYTLLIVFGSVFASLSVSFIIFILICRRPRLISDADRCVGSKK